MRGMRCLLAQFMCKAGGNIKGSDDKAVVMLFGSYIKICLRNCFKAIFSDLR